MSFAGTVKGWTEQVGTTRQEIFAGSVEAVKDSIVEGSAVTGAPGQPVAVGGNARLKNSWTSEIDGDLGLVWTDVDYAPDVEAGTRNGRAMAHASPVGGWHSVELTKNNFDLLVRQVARDAVGP